MAAYCLEIIIIEYDNWYFDNITEDIIYGDIETGGKWLEMARRIKKEAVIRKMANDLGFNTDTLPQVLGKAIDLYRANLKIRRK